MSYVTMGVLGAIALVWLIAVVTGGWSRWVAFVSYREPGLPLAVFRMALGASGLILVGSMLWSGNIPIIWFDVADGGYRTLGNGSWLTSWFGGPSARLVTWIVIVALFSHACVVLGLGGRVTAFLALQANMGLTDLNPDAGGSYDELLSNGLWIAVLGNCNATWSLDCRLRTGQWTSDAQVAAWPRWLAIFQIVLCYWTTGLQKVSAHWVPGGDFSALYYILQQPTWQRFDMRWVAYVYPFTQVGTAVTWFWEVLSPLWLLAFFFRATRTRGGRMRAWFNSWDMRTQFALVGVSFHLLVTVLMDIGPFSWVSLAYYAALFHGDEYTAFIARSRRWLERTGRSFRRSPGTPPSRSASSTSGP